MNKEEAKKRASILRGVIEYAQYELDELEKLYEEAKRTYGEHSYEAREAYTKHNDLYNQCLRLKKEYDERKGEAEGTIMSDEEIDALADMMIGGYSSENGSSDEEDDEFLNELANML